MASTSRVWSPTLSVCAVIWPSLIWSSAWLCMHVSACESLSVQSEVYWNIQVKSPNLTQLASSRGAHDRIFNLDLTNSEFAIPGRLVLKKGRLFWFVHFCSVRCRWVGNKVLLPQVMASSMIWLSIGRIRAKIGLLILWCAPGMNDIFLVLSLAG